MDINIYHGTTSNTVTFPTLNINLSATCNQITQPLNVDVCQAGYAVNFYTGATAETELSFIPGIDFGLDEVAFGTETNVILQQSYLFYPVFEFGQELLDLDIQESVIFPVEFETGLDSDIDGIVLPPRAILDMDAQYGSGIESFEFPNTINLFNTCNPLQSPLDFNLCSSKSAVIYWFGAEATFELETILASGIELEPFETGSLFETILGLFQFIECDAYYGQELLGIDFQISYTFIGDAYYGQELSQLDLIIPPRALLELDSEFGQEFELDTIQITTKSFNLDGYLGFDADMDLTPACLGVIPLNTWINGYLDDNCSSVHRSAYAKYYSFELLLEKEVTIDTSSTYDNYLYLLDGIGSGGNVITEDDDSGSGLNAKIVWTLPAGNYTVEFASFSGGITGGFQLRVQIPTPDITDAIIEFGQEFNDFGISTISNINVDIETGLYSDVDLEINPFDKLDVTNEFGQELLDVGLFHTPNFQVNPEFGQESNVDLEINPFDKLDVTNEFGQELNELTLAVSDQLSVDYFEIGLYSDVDLEINPFDELSVNFGYGQYALVSALSVAASLNCYIKFGSDASLDLELAVSEGLGELTGYHGTAFELSEISTDELTIRFAYGSDVSIDIESHIIFTCDAEYGSGATFEIDTNPFDELDVTYEYGSQLEDTTLSTSVIFSILSESGFESELNELTLPPRAFIDAKAEHGLESNIKETILNLRPIEYNVGLDFYVKHNHCESCCDNVDPYYLDSTLRLDNVDDYHDGNLKFEFSTDNFKDDYPWTICDEYEVKFDFALKTNARFQIDFEVDGFSAIAFMPPELTAFVEGVPLEYLYLDTSPKPQFHTFEVDFNVTMASWVWGEDWTTETVYTRHAPNLEVELTDTRYVELYNGSAFTLETIHTDIPEWKTDAFSPIRVASSLEVILELEDYIRFCPGYIIPNGNQVNFEYYGVESTNCNIEYFYHASTIELDSLSTYQSFFVGTMKNGIYATASLFTELPWQVLFGHGVRVYLDGLATTAQLSTGLIGHGSVVSIEFEALGFPMYHSPVECFAELSVPGPGLLWVTTEGCLPNQYIRVDEDGDVDLEYYQPDPEKDFVEYPFGITIENRHYKHNLDARCIKI